MLAENAVCGSLDRRIGLIETLRFDPAAGAVRAALHLARMQASAMHFGKIFHLEQAERMLAAVAAGQPLRLRLLLDDDDRLSLATHPFQPVQQGAVWTVRIATTRLSSNDPLLAHKTTARQTYEAARAEFALEDADEVLMENENGHLCEGTFTSLFVSKGGTLVTPRLSHGLLRGVLRQELIDSGKATEGDITRTDLLKFPFFIGNSLRGLIAGRFSGS